MKKNKTAKQRNKEIEEDKKIIDIICKLGGGVKEKNKKTYLKN